MSTGTHVGTHVHQKQAEVDDNLDNGATWCSLHFREFNDGLTSCTESASFTTHEETLRFNTEDLRDAQTAAPLPLRRHFLRTSAGLASCSLLTKAKINPKQLLVRFCHSRGQSIVPAQCEGHQTSFSSTQPDGPGDAQLTHTDTQGKATMVDVGGKVPTRRTACASASVVLGPTAFRLLQDNQLVKGDALTVAQLAGIMASKQTSTLIPLCHPLPLDHVSVTFHLDEQRHAVIIAATCRTTGRTGVEMEALTAASVAALTVYDMCKAVSHDIIITDVKLVRKTGGKRDFHRETTQGD